MKKRLIQAALIASLLFVCLGSSAALAALPGWENYYPGSSSATPDGWQYALNPNTNTMAITGYSGTNSIVTVPAAITENGNSYAVEYIAGFSDNNYVTDIEIPGGVMGLGDWLFFSCPLLQSVTVPASVVDIGQGTFSETPGGFVVYGNSGTAAEAAALEQGVPFVALDKGQTIARGVENDFTYIVRNSEAAITGYTGGLSAVTLPQTAGGFPVKAVGRSAFRNSDLLEVTVPQGVTSLDDMAFFNAMSLQKISLPASLEHIGSMGLSCCDALTSLVLPNGLVSLGPDALSQCNSLASLTVPGTLREAGHGAFSYLPAAQIPLPEGVTVISEWLFSGSGITSFTVPNSVTEIRDGAFSDCYNLSEITIPGGVTFIDPGAFGNRLQSGFIMYGYSGSAAEAFAKNAGIPFVALDLGQTATTGVTSDGYTYVALNSEAAITGYTGSQPTTLTLPAQAGGFPVTSVAQGAFYCRSDIVEVVIPSGVVTIGDSAFGSCWNMTKITLPTTLKNLGNFALADCESLASLNLPGGLTRLGRYSVSQCMNLTSVSIPAGLSAVEKGAFSMSPCHDVTTFPQGVTAISDELFWGCDLHCFIVPDSVTSIGWRAFSSCHDLQYVVIPAGVTQIDAEAFVDLEMGYNPNLIIYGYAGTEAERHAAQVGLRFSALDAPAASAVLTLPSNLTTLDQQALSGTAAEAVYIPASCAAIASQTFAQCRNLRTVHIAGLTTTVASDAFDGCPHPVAIYAPAGSAAQAFARDNGLAWFAE